MARSRVNIRHFEMGVDGRTSSHKTAAVWPFSSYSYFTSSETLDFHMVVNLLVHAFYMHMLMSLSVDEILQLIYELVN